MNRKILMSVGAIAFVAALSLGATGAFFSDTETSTGNTFTAGAIDLTIDSQQHYNNAICVPNTTTTGDLTDYYWQLEPQASATNPQYPVIGSPCNGTWALTNLQNGVQKFFNFTDVKPGDSGEDTISLHVTSNPAWACIDVAITKNNDETCNEPELGDDPTCTDPAAPGASNAFDGELAQNLNFFAWLDQGATPGWQNTTTTPQADPTEGDNIWQGDATEPHLFSNVIGPASDALNGKHYTLAAPPLAPLVASSTNYIGLAWCAGALTTTGGNAPLVCNGATMNNAAQTDSMTADITFRVEQARNNPNFSCNPTVQEGTGTVTLDKVVTFTSTAIAGVDVTDYTLHLVGPGGDHILVDQVPFPGLTAGAYVVSEVYTGPANATSTAVFSGSCTEIGTTDTATMNVVAGVNPTCTITNSVSPL